MIKKYKDEKFCHPELDSISKIFQTNKYINLIKENTFIEEKYKRIPKGFSYTAFLFGAFLSITRQDNVSFIIFAVIEIFCYILARVLTFGYSLEIRFLIVLLIYRLILGFVYNYWDLIRLKCKGYKEYV